VHLVRSFLAVAGRISLANAQNASTNATMLTRMPMFAPLCGMVTRCDRAYAFLMSGGGVVAGGLILGVALWVPVSHMSGVGHHNVQTSTHHSPQFRSHQHSGQAHQRPVPPTVTYYLRPSDLAALTHHSDAVFAAKITGAHARMYRGSPEPYRLFSFKPVARIKGNVNPSRKIWQSTSGHSAQTRIEVGHTYLLATHNTPGSPYLVLHGPRAVTQIR
jgi:hypothetical protein